MNIVMIMAGGVGKRFKAELPKQYVKLNGKPVIDYVIEAVKKSKLTDRIVVVIDEKYINYSEELKKKDNRVDIAPNGKERYDSLRNGFDLINEKYNCENILIADAVAPFISSQLIDEYFNKLEKYDGVITAQKITGALGNYNFDILDREKYYMTQSPEAFKFKKIYKNFNPNLETQELGQHLPKGSKFYLNFDFKNNLKLTYNFELEYAASLMKQIKIKQNKNESV